jgi:hypothetical protein
MTCDDFGTQKGLFMAPEMWREFLRPGFRAFIELANGYGHKVAHPSSVLRHHFAVKPPSTAMFAPVT